MENFCLLSVDFFYLRFFGSKIDKKMGDIFLSKLALFTILLAYFLLEYFCLTIVPEKTVKNAFTCIFLDF